MTKLNNAKVYRGGQTARGLDEVKQPNVSLYGSILGRISFDFSLPSKGGGITKVRIEIGPDDFYSLAAAMTEAHREHSMLVMAKTLSRKLAEQPELDQMLMRSGRNSVVKAAKDACKKAPASHNHAERLTHEMVQQLVEQLNEPDEKKAE